MTPFYIADFQSGLFTAKDEWIAPASAFPKLKNVRVRRGKVVRRKGFKIKGYFPSRIHSSGTAVTLSWADDGSDNVEVTTSAVHGLSTGDAVIFQGVTGNGSTNLDGLTFFVTVTSTTIFTLDNISWAGLHASPSPSGGSVDQLTSLSKKGEISGISQADPGVITTSSAHGLSTGNLVLITGDFSNSLAGMTSIDGTVTTISVLSTTTFALNDVDTSGFTAWSSGGDVALIDTTVSEIVGMGELFKNEANNVFLVANVDRLAKYVPGNETFQPVTHNTLGDADVFTGDNDEYFQMVNGFSQIWITNFKDRPQTYNGTTFDHATFDIDNDSSNEITRVRHLFQYNRRMVLLYTVEDGTSYPQRARWSRIDFGTGSTNEWDDQADDTNAGSLDADTDEEIISAGFLKDRLIVFFESSIWSLEKTGSFDPPFRWVKIADNPSPFGAPFGIVSDGKFLLSTGLGGIVGTDGYNLIQADTVIPDFEDEIALGDFNKVFGLKNISERELWISYPSTTTSANDKIKVFDYENKTWTEYDIELNVAGEFTGALSARAWSNFNVEGEDEWENVNQRWDDFAAPRGTPKIWFGNSQGIIYEANSGTSDAGTKIESLAETMRFNPFKEQGKSAHLVYIDLLFTQNPGTTLKIELFSDFEEIAYDVQYLDLDNDSSRDEAGKLWKRLFVNRIANSHKIRISNESTDQNFEEHGMVMWFKPAGDLHQL